MMIKNVKRTVGFFISAVLFATCAIVTGAMDNAPSWLPQVMDGVCIVCSLMGIHVTVPKDKESEESKEKLPFREEREDGKAPLSESAESSHVLI